MTERRTDIRRAIARLHRRLGRTKADESGLTTLEWLLIVAAVAGLAALAVVLVQNVVDDTSEQISGSSARVTAAKVAAEAIVSDSASDAASQPADAKTYGPWASYYTSKCNRLIITYGDAGISVTPNFTFHGAGIVESTDQITATDVDVPGVATTTVVAVVAASAVAQCIVQ